MITPASDQPTYTAVTVEQDQLKVITKQANGAVLEAFSIKDNASEETAKITMVADPISAPVSVSYTVNGETVSTMLPAVVEVGKGDVLQVEAVACNTFDYAVTGWTQGETVLSENGTLAYTVEGDKLLTVKAERVGLTSLAEGKTVTADAVNADWAARHLTDGVVSHLGGNTGWSSKYIGKGTSFSERTAVIDFGEETVMNAFRLYGRTDSTGNASNFPTAYTIYTSSDNAQWTPVYTVTDGAVPALYVPAVIELEEAVTARYVKLGVTAVNRGDENGNVYVQLAEFGVYNDLPSDQELADQVIALIAAVDHDDKTAIDAARTAYDALSDAQKALVTNYAELEAAELYWNTVHNEVALVLSGADSVYANDGKVVYTLSAKDMNNLATVALTIDISEEFLSEPVAEPVGNWLIVAQAWKDGVLHVVAANFEGVSGDGDILTITAKPVEKAGTASVTVAAAELGAYLEEGETFVNADLDGASVNTEIQHNRFDVNKDGVVDLRDIARAQRSYGDKNTDADVNADGIVDIDDLILILNNYTDLIE